MLYILNFFIVLVSLFVASNHVSAQLTVATPASQLPELKLLQNPYKKFERTFPTDFELLNLKSASSKELMQELVQNIIDEKHASSSYTETYKSNTNTKYHYGYQISDKTDSNITITFNKIEVGPFDDMRFGGKLSYTFDYEIERLKDKTIFKIKPNSSLKEVKVRENSRVKKYTPLINDVEEEDFLKFINELFLTIESKAFKLYIVQTKTIKTTKTFEEVDAILGNRMIGPFFFPRNAMFMKAIEKLHTKKTQSRYFARYKDKRVSVNYHYTISNDNKNEVEVLLSMSNSCSLDKCELNVEEINKFTDELLVGL